MPVHAHRRQASGPSDRSSSVPRFTTTARGLGRTGDHCRSAGSAAYAGSVREQRKGASGRVYVGAYVRVCVCVCVRVRVCACECMRVIEAELGSRWVG